MYTYTHIHIYNNIIVIIVITAGIAKSGRGDKQRHVFECALFECFRVPVPVPW